VLRVALVLATAALMATVPAALATPDRPATRHAQAVKRVHAVKRVAKTTRALLVNGSFESGLGLSGWGGYKATLSLARDGVVGSGAAKVTANRGVSDFSITPSPAPVASSTAGATYTASAWLRSATPGRRVCLRIREFNGSALVADASSCVTSTSAWKQIPAVAYKVHAGGNRVDAYVFEAPAVSGDSFEVDGIDLAVSTPVTTTTPPPTTTTTPVTTTTPTTTTTPAPTTTTTPTTTTAPPPATPPANGCALYASTAGSDAAAGSAAAPFRTVQKLSDSLAAGQTGCVQPGTYSEDLRVAHGGSQGSPVTIQSADPAQRATIVGRLYVTKSASDVVLQNLNLNGRNASNLPSPTVNATRITFRNDDVTNDHTGICFDLGNDDYGIAYDTVIDRNRIHDCGVLPSTNMQHGIYVAVARNTQITNNVIYDNADRGIQLYPDAQGTTIANNVIDGNGEGVIFSSGELAGRTSSNNRVYRNVITNSLIRFNVEYYWGDLIGQNNTVESNCVWNGKQGNVSDQVGFVATGTVTADPLYQDRAAKDFRLRAGSPCAGFGPQG
jgi:parallel beta-helix repeat protein